VHLSLLLINYVNQPQHSLLSQGIQSESIDPSSWKDTIPGLRHSSFHKSPSAYSTIRDLSVLDKASKAKIYLRSTRITKSAISTSMEMVLWMFL
jgi:hypothetical protein